MLRRAITLIRGLWPLTLPGMLLTTLGALAYVYYGRGEFDFILLAGCALALGVVALCLLLTLCGAGVLALRLRGEAGAAPVARSTVVGAATETDFTCATLRWWPLISVQIRWLNPEDVEVTVGRSGGRLTERVTFKSRGRYSEITRQITVGDLLGVTALSFPVTRPAALRVAPAIGGADLTTILRQTSGEALSHPAGEPQGEYIEMRRYQPGDPVRMIVWKAYARSRRLLVRVPERAISPTPSAVAALVAGPGDEPAASVARMFLEQGLLGADFVFTADGAPRPVSNPGEALEAIIDSAHHRADGGAGLEQLLTEVPPAQLARCLIFAPGAPGPWLDRVAAFIARLPAAPTLVLAVDEVPRGAEPGRLGRLGRLMVAEPTPEAERRARLAALAPVYAGLQAAGAHVILLHRPSGRALEGAQLEALDIRPGATSAATGA